MLLYCSANICYLVNGHHISEVAANNGNGTTVHVIMHYFIICTDGMLDPQCGMQIYQHCRMPHLIFNVQQNTVRSSYSKHFNHRLIE